MLSRSQPPEPLSLGISALVLWGVESGKWRVFVDFLYRKYGLVTWGGFQQSFLEKQQGGGASGFRLQAFIDGPKEVVGGPASERVRG